MGQKETVGRQKDQLRDCCAFHHLWNNLLEISKKNLNVFRGRWWGSLGKENKRYLKAMNRYTYIAYVWYISTCVCLCVWAWIGPEDCLHCGGCERLAWLPGACNGHQGSQENQRDHTGGRRDEELGFGPDELKVTMTHAGRVEGKEVRNMGLKFKRKV